MAKRTGGVMRNTFGWRAVLLLGALLAGTMAVAQDKKEVNGIKSIRTISAGVEIELHSTTAFLQSDLPVLQIGEQEFTLSRSPDDGDLNILIFKLSSGEFARTSSGDRVIFQYGRGEGRNKRDFGRLDKSKRDR